MPQQSAPSRIAGLAFAYAQVRPFLNAPDDQALVEAWLSARATAPMACFDTGAPKNASRNNLRAWAGLAVARIGLTVNDTAMIDWADATVRLIVCQAADDGSLPLEMARQELALHYQLHAITPLVITAALLQDRGDDLLRLKLQVQHHRPFGHRILQWTNEASTSAARNVACFWPRICAFSNWPGPRPTCPFPVAAA